MPLNKPTSAAYDYIIVGAGCAGLSLLMRLIKQDDFKEKSILLIDKTTKNSNDRTWCFWERHDNFFESTVAHRWSKLVFFAPGYHSVKPIAPYQYKMIRSKAFYETCFNEIKRHSNIQLVQEEVLSIKNKTQELVEVSTTTRQYQAEKVFSSVLPQTPQLSAKDIYLLQHFKGYMIECDHAHFDADLATFMDFRISQEHGCSFVYVLPLSAKKALVEYTLFSAALLNDDQYDETLRSYIQQYLGIKQYEVVETEFGIIPMTNYNFKQVDGNIIYLGVAGGATKPSSGYTFSFIQKQCDQLVQELKSQGNKLKPVHRARFRFYDHVLLYLLNGHRLGGRAIFKRLFERNKFSSILKFLDNETSLLEEARIFSTLQIAQFTKASLRLLLQKFKA